MATRYRRSPEVMAVVHLGRAMNSLSRSGLADDRESSEHLFEFRRAERLLAEASDALLDALEKRDGIRPSLDDNESDMV